MVLKGDQLYVSEKEVKDEKNIQEVFDLSDYEKCEELRKSKSRSKKNHSKFTLAHSKQPGNTAPNLIFLAVSPEEKESWISALNSAITRAKNRILDEVGGSSCGEGCWGRGSSCHSLKREGHAAGPIYLLHHSVLFLSLSLKTLFSFHHLSKSVLPVPLSLLYEPLHIQ